MRGKVSLRRSDQAPVSHAEWVRRLRERIAAIPPVVVPRMDPQSIAGPLIKELPEDAARFASTLEAAGTVDALVDLWIRFVAELAPDWSVESGFADTPRLTRYSTRLNQTLALMNVLVLQKLRSLPASTSTLDGRLFERELEAAVLPHVLFGPELKDPRAPLWSVRASAGVKDKPALLADRLEQIPGQIREFLPLLAEAPPRLWIERALRELNDVLELLRDYEQSSPGDRVKAAVGKVREELVAYGTRLRSLEGANRPLPAQDPRWIAFMIQDVEFSGRTLRQTAELLLEISNKAESGWNSWDGIRNPASVSYGFEEWRQEVRRLAARSRDITVELGFAEVPPGELPEIVTSPHISRNWREWPHYRTRLLGPSLEARLRVTPWEGFETQKALCSPESALFSTMGETYPGRHLHAVLSRRDGTLMRRIYSSSTLSEGWSEYSRRWALEREPAGSFHRAAMDGFRHTQGFAGAVEICFLSGTLSESEALTMLQAGNEEAEESARSRLGWASLEPLVTTHSVLGEHDLVALRVELQTKLGARFDLKRFHTRVLGYGHTPVALIREELLRDWK
ncbi:MAG: DUF885 family protein [Planctomycetes bacterium]|nr:DUF885 family protein [Planctomycetota bacterium]